jgi:ABC-type branched-subunit amino acid transport system substrate-binding protein
MTRRGRQFARLLAVFLGLALVAGACGNDDETDASATTTTEAGSGAEGDDGADDATGGATDVGVTEDTIRVSQIVSQSGVNAAGHQGFEKGFQVYVEALNERGGVHGRTIEIVDTFDDQSDPARNSELFRRIADSDVFAVVGSWPSFGGAELARDNNIPVIGAAYADGWHLAENFFGVTGGTWVAEDISNRPTPPGSPVNAYIMEKQGDTLAGTFGYTQAASANAAETACDRINDFNDIGLECVYTDTSLEFGFTDLGASIAAIQDSGATHFYAGMDIGGCVTILRSFLRAGMDDVTLNCAVGYGRETIENFGEFIENMYIVLTTQPFDGDHLEIQTFVEELTTRMPGEEPSTTILNGWLAGIFLEDVLTELGPNVTRARFVETVRSAEPFTAWDANGIIGAIDYTVNLWEALEAGTYDPDPDLCAGILVRPDVDNVEWVQVGQQPQLCLAGIRNGADLRERMADDDSSLEIDGS